MHLSDVHSCNDVHLYAVSFALCALLHRSVLMMCTCMQTCVSDVHCHDICNVPTSITLIAARGRGGSTSRKNKSEGRRAKYKLEGSMCFELKFDVELSAL